MRSAVMRQHLLVVRGDQRELLGERRRRLAPAGREIARDLAGQPRPALRGAADHHRVGAGRCERRVGIVEGR